MSNTDTDSEAPLFEGPFDADLAADVIGLKGKQRAFAMARYRGLNAVESARAAGYGGQDSTLRSTGSRVNRTGKVQRFLKWAREGQSANPAAPGDLKEIEAKLWLQLRSPDHAAQKSAIDHLVKLGLVQPVPTDTVPEPAQVLGTIETEFGPEIAALICIREGGEALFENDSRARHLGEIFCPECLKKLHAKYRIPNVLSPDSNSAHINDGRDPEATAQSGAAS